MSKKFMGFTASALAVSILMGGISISAKSQPKTALKSKKITMQEGTKKRSSEKQKEKYGLYVQIIQCKSCKGIQIRKNNRSEKRKSKDLRHGKKERGKRKKRSVP